MMRQNPVPPQVGLDLCATARADAALSEKSPYLGGAQVRLSLWRTLGCRPMTS